MQTLPDSPPIIHNETDRSDRPAGAVRLQMEEIYKAFPGGVQANKGINLEVLKGEVHGLLGENGAGKTTLMNILYGMVQPDSGRIYINGRPITVNSPRDAITNGIGMVHQHFMLIPRFTVAENVILGLKEEKFHLDIPAIERKIRALSDHYGFKIDPSARVADIPLGMQQRVEILKELYRGAELLILDEPTAVLTPQEVDELVKILRHLAKEGRSIVFISHKLAEVLAVTDRITVLRDGELIGTILTRDADYPTLANMMVGRDVQERMELPPMTPGDAVIELDRVSAADDRGTQLLTEISLEVRSGEIVGIAGVDGNGQRELTEVISGIRRPLDGAIRILGVVTNGKGPRQLQRMGVGHIHEDRHASGLILEFNIAENLVLESYSYPPYARSGFLNPAAVHDNAKKLISAFAIKAPDYRTPVRTLSGGNQQRVALARTLASEPRVVIASQPTRGLDITATEYVRQLLIEQRSAGAAILLISTELDEVLALSDRIAVIYSGRLMGVVRRAEAEIFKIGQMMTGTPLTEL